LMVGWPHEKRGVVGCFLREASCKDP